MKKIFILLFLLFGWISAVSAENFYIDNYDITLDVDSLNNIKIEENIDAIFTKSSHGIYRTIPTVNNIIRKGSAKYKTYGKVKNLYVSEMYDAYMSDNNYVVKIGHPDKLITGRHNYKIKYDYELENPKSEFYFNVIGTGWDTNINRVNFKIYMPKDFPYDKAGISMGGYKVQGFKEGAEFWVNKDTNTIEGYTTRPLLPHEGITVRIELPDGYFTKKYNPQKPFCIFLITIFTLISYIVWFAYGKDDIVIPVVNFYPPKGVTSGAVGVMYKGKAEINQVVSLIIYLADKGYLRIEEENNNTKIIKVKEYNGKLKELKMLMEALFKHDRYDVYLTELEVSTLFYKECSEIVAYLDKIKELIFEKDSISLAAKTPFFATIAGLFIILYLTTSNFTFNFEILMPTIIVSIFPIAAIIMLFGMYSKIGTKKGMIFPAIFALLYGGVPLLSVLTMNQAALERNFGTFLYCIAGLIIIGICLYQLPKRNKQGIKMLGHILGFKKFLETAEAHKIQELVKINPEYCFNVLPYAYVLGVSDAWIKKFESAINYPPDWYKGNFNTITFNNLTSAIHDVSTPSVSNGGISTSSSGGGGCSGGGSGGGGGGSW